MILYIYGQLTLNNRDLPAQCELEDIIAITAKKIKKHWKWVGYVLQRDPSNTANVATL